MILVIGGAASGKRAYVKTLGYSDADISPDIASSKPVLCELEALVSRDPSNCMEYLESICEKEVVICNEVGSGIIPIEAQNRQAREQTGRLCILLAERAHKVVRMVCGLPTVLKG